MLLFLKVVDGDEIKKKTKLSIPHTAHCLGTGEVMVCTMGDENESRKGEYTTSLHYRCL